MCIPQVQLQLCLFHVLRTFGREVTVSKMSITGGERQVLLEHIQSLTYASTVEEYEERLLMFYEACPNQQVKRYYDTNWGNITEQWVAAYTSKYLNLGQRTTNRVESFFGKLKDLIQKRKTIREMFSDVLTTIEVFHKIYVYSVFILCIFSGDWFLFCMVWYDKDTLGQVTIILIMFFLWMKCTIILIGSIILYGSILYVIFYFTSCRWWRWRKSTKW